MKSKDILFKIIFQSITLKRIIFQYVKDINSNLTRVYFKKDNKYSWEDLGCFPHLLVRFNYNDRFKKIFDTFIINKVQLKPIGHSYFQKFKNLFSNFDKDETLTFYRLLFINSLTEAAKYGYTDLIQHVYKALPNQVRLKELLKPAIKHGQLEVVKLVYQIDENRSAGLFKEAIEKAARYGHLSIIEYLHHSKRNDIVCTTNAMNSAASNGYLDVVKFLHFNRTEGCTYDAINLAAMRGHLEVIIWLHENRTEGCTVKAIEYAARVGRLEIVKWLHDNRTEGCTAGAMDFSACFGHLETVLFLHYNRTEGCTTRAMDLAAENGHMEIVKWLHENRTEGCTTNAMDRAAISGNLPMVEFLHFNRTEGCTEAAKNTAAFVSFRLFKFLHENRTERCNWNALSNSLKSQPEITKLIIRDYPECWESNTLLDNVAQFLNLEVFKFVHSNYPALPCTTKAMDYFSAKREALQWLHENRTEGCSENIYRNAVESGDVENLIWIRKNKPEININALIAVRAIRLGFLEIVQYLQSINAPFPPNELDYAEDLKMIEFLHFKGSGCTTKVMDNAMKRKDFESIKFLTKYRSEGHKKHDLFVYDLFYGYPSRIKLIQEFKL